MSKEEQILKLQNLLKFRKQDYEYFGCTKEDQMKDIEIEAEIRKLKNII